MLLVVPRSVLAVVAGFFAAQLAVAQPIVRVTCPETSPTSQWTDCVGKLIRAKTMFYHGEFKDGSPHGLGREADIENSTVYVGTFVAGKRIGSGVEYSFLRKILRTGIWSGTLQRQLDLDANLFPYDGPDSKDFFSNFYRPSGPTRASSTPAASGQSLEELRLRLRQAEERIRDLEAINRELNERLDSRTASPADAASGRVQQCIRLGRTPGTSDFSKCVNTKK